MEPTKPKASKSRVGRLKVCCHCQEEFFDDHYRDSTVFCSKSCASLNRAGKDRSTPAPPNLTGCSWIPVGEGKFTLVDEDIFIEVKDRSWVLHKDRYAATQVFADGKHYRRLLQHVVMGIEPGSLKGTKTVLDHINGDGLDNRRSNLRLISFTDNLRNTTVRAGNISGFKGVSYRKDNNKWRSAISVNYKKIRLGDFDTPEEAALRYDQEARIYHGDKGRYNFPREGEQPALRSHS